MIMFKNDKFDDGLVNFYTLENVAKKGLQPKMKLVELTGDMYFGNQTIGVTRKYQAQGADKRIDLLIRTHFNDQISEGVFAQISYSDFNGQYKVDFVQQKRNDKGLKICEITLVKDDAIYEIAE